MTTHTVTLPDLRALSRDLRVELAEAREDLAGRIRAYQAGTVAREYGRNAIRRAQVRRDQLEALVRAVELIDTIRENGGLS